MNNHNTEILTPNWCMINLQEIIANHASKLLWGNSYTLTSEHPEYKNAI